MKLNNTLLSVLFDGRKDHQHGNIWRFLLLASNLCQVCPFFQYIERKNNCFPSEVWTKSNDDRQLRKKIFRVVKNRFPSVCPGDIFSGTQYIGVTEKAWSIVLSQRLEMRILLSTTIKKKKTIWPITLYTTRIRWSYFPQRKISKL